MKFEWDTFEDLDRWISDATLWGRIDNAQFQDFIGVTLVLLGKEEMTRRRALFPKVFSLYIAAVERLNKEQRLSLYESLISLLDVDPFSSLALLPIVACEPDVALASTATVDLLAYSVPAYHGLPSALIELTPMLAKRIPANMGAVVGGLVAFGDTRLRYSTDGVRSVLTNAEVGIAARCTTGFPTHAAIDFWLNWAEEIALDPTDDALHQLGSAASAILLQKRNAHTEVVRDIKRNYPAQRTEKPIELLREWTFAQYAAQMAPRLYALEAVETPPKVFSNVLEEWGLAPRALEKDRFNA